MATVLSPPGASASPVTHASLAQMGPLSNPSPQRRPSNNRSKASSTKSRLSTASNAASGNANNPSSASASNSTKRQSQSYVANRLSTFSTTSRTSRTNSQSNLRGDASRTHSTVFPLFHSSLPYALVRDFGYPITDPMHYGPVPDASGLATPSSEVNRRLSDPAPPSFESAWGILGGAGIGPGSWSATDEYAQLPSRSFADNSDWGWRHGNDSGPPYSEDEDLQSPVVSAHGGGSRHRKQHSNIAGFDAQTSRPRRGKHRSRKRAAAAAQGEAGYDDAGEKRQSHASTLPSRSFHEGETYSSSDDGSSADEDDDSDEEDLSASQILSPYSASTTTATQVTHPDHPDDPGGDAHHNRHSLTYTFSIGSPDEEVNGKAVSLYNFERENDNELPLAEGQIILVSYRLSQGWLVAQDPRSGESGLVPESYVRLLRDLEGGDWEAGAPDADAGGAHAHAHALGAGDETPVAESAAAAAAGHVEGVPLPTSEIPPSEDEQRAEAERRQQQQQQQQPAVTSTFSTSREDLEPRIDLISPVAGGGGGGVATPSRGASTKSKK